jgi:hypothetical protein
MQNIFCLSLQLSNQDNDHFTHAGMKYKCQVILNSCNSQYGPYDIILTDWFQSERPFTLLAVMEKTPVGFAMLRLPEDNPFASERIGELLAIAVYL